MTRFTITTAAIAALAVAFIGSASADPGGKKPYDVAKECLLKVSTTYNGQTFYLKEGIHFGTYAGSGDPDDVIAAGIWIRAGLREHASWKDHVSEIEGCLKHIPNLRYVGRSN
jgi:hypothetical protein